MVQVPQDLLHPSNVLLRNVLNEERLNHRMFLHIHKHLVDPVNLITILQEFIAVNDRRINFIWKEVCSTVTSVVTSERS